MKISNYLMGCGVFYRKKQEPETEKLYHMANENQIEQLKTLIVEELKDCNHVLWPNVCSMQSTEKVLAKLQEMIIRLIAEEGMGIGSAIAFIEQELAHNIS